MLLQNLNFFILQLQIQRSLKETKHRNPTECFICVLLLEIRVTVAQAISHLIILGAVIPSVFHQVIFPLEHLLVSINDNTLHYGSAKIQVKYDCYQDDVKNCFVVQGPSCSLTIQLQEPSLYSMQFVIWPSVLFPGLSHPSLPKT